jgi:hypothetical protein
LSKLSPTDDRHCNSNSTTEVEAEQLARSGRVPTIIMHDESTEELKPAWRDGAFFCLSSAGAFLHTAICHAS